MQSWSTQVNLLHPNILWQGGVHVCSPLTDNSPPFGLFSASSLAVGKRGGSPEEMSPGWSLSTLRQMSG